MGYNFKVDSVPNDDVERQEYHGATEFRIVTKLENVAQKVLYNFIKQKDETLISYAKNTAKRISTKRTFDNKHDTSKTQVCVDEDGKKPLGSERKYEPFVSGVAYCISSCSMILLNKTVLSNYGFDAGMSLMFYQNFISVFIVFTLGLFGVVSTEKFSWKLIRLWIPVNIIFIGMLVSGMYSLKYINIAMVTILKNMTSILTAIGEAFIFKKHQSKRVWTAMFLMVISAVCGGITDLSFDATGYTWQIINCILTASYSLTLRQAMDTAKSFTKSGSMNEISMVFLNNALSLPFAIFLIFTFRELEYVYNVDVTKMPMFWVAATASGIVGLAISFTSMWFLKQTGPTTHSLVGSLNKIPTSMAGIVLFNVPLGLPNFSSILFGLFAGVFFARAKISK